MDYYNQLKQKGVKVPPAADGGLILTQQVQEDKLQGGPAQTLGAASTAEARAQPGCPLGAPFPSVIPSQPVAPPWPSDSEFTLAAGRGLTFSFTRTQRGA